MSQKVVHLNTSQLLGQVTMYTKPLHIRGWGKNIQLHNNKQPSGSKCGYQGQGQGEARRISSREESKPSIQLYWLYRDGDLRVGHSAMSLIVLLCYLSLILCLDPRWSRSRKDCKRFTGHITKAQEPPGKKERDIKKPKGQHFQGFQSKVPVCWALLMVFPGCWDLNPCSAYWSTG